MQIGEVILFQVGDADNEDEWKYVFFDARSLHLNTIEDRGPEGTIQVTAVILCSELSFPMIGECAHVLVAHYLLLCLTS